MTNLFKVEFFPLVKTLHFAFLLRSLLCSTKYGDVYAFEVFPSPSQAGENRKQNALLQGKIKTMTKKLRSPFDFWSKALNCFPSSDHGSTVRKYAYASCSKLFPHPLRLDV